MGRSFSSSEHVIQLIFCMYIGAEPNIRDMRGYTALGYALRRGHPDIIEALRAAGD